MSWAQLVQPTHRDRLDSGLQVLAVDRREQPFAVVLSLLLGGSRVDPPGAGGMAHLTEHLLAQGRSPDGQRWITPLLALGAELDATTHPDLLEFCTAVPYAGLAHALAAERDRLGGWPRLPADVFERQQAGVCREIEDHRARPSGALPWPALGVRAFGSWAEGHDPFGDVEQVRALTEEDCRAFSLRQHRPAGAVIVVVADLGRLPGGFEAVLTALDAVYPPAPGAPSTPVSAGSGEPGVHPAESWTLPHSVAAAAWRTPSVVDDPETYAGMFAVAAHLDRAGQRRCRLGQMTPMDRADGDALTVTTIDPADARPGLDRVLEEVALLAGGAATEPALTRAIDRARTELAARLDRPRTRAQLLGRAALLARDPHAAGRWVAAVEGLRPDQVVAAAGRLVASPPVGMVGRPESRAASPVGLVPRPPSSACVRPRAAGSARLLRLERPTLTAAVHARLAGQPGSELIDRLRASDHRLNETAGGWLLESVRLGRADVLAAQVRAELGDDAAVDQVVLVGRGAGAAEPWRSAATSVADHPAGTPAELRITGLVGQPQGVAVAELEWPVPKAGFCARWLGLALLAGVHRRDQCGELRPLDAPTGTVIVPRQQPGRTGPRLVFEAYAASELLPAALAHLARELSPDRLRRRARAASEAAAIVVEGWRRDRQDTLTLARRAAAMLELGAADDDVRDFDVRLSAVTSEEVVRRLLIDTQGAPRGVIRTARPDLLEHGSLPDRWRPTVLAERS